MKAQIIIFFFILASSFSVQAQAQEVMFYYDYAGNRTLLKVIGLDENAMKSDSADIATMDEIIGQPAKYETTLQNAEIKIYPNPTAGQIYLSVNPLQENSKVEIKASTGANIFQGQLDQEITTIDLRHHPKGVYYLELSCGIQKEAWKIIKN